MPIVGGWKNPQQTYEYVQRYLDGKDRELWPAIIDYLIGQLFLLRSDAEALRVNPAKRKKEESTK